MGAGGALNETGRRDPSLTRRLLLRGALVGGATLALTACSRAAPPPPVVRVQLRLTAYERARFTSAILPPFERARGVRVEIASGTIDETLADLRAGRRPVDLLALDTEALGPLIDERLLRPVEEQRATLRDALQQPLLPALTRDDRLYALPYRPAIWLTFYDSARLASAGVAPPRGWDDLLAAAGALRAAGGVALQGAVGPPAAQSFTELLWAFGAPGYPLALTGDDARAAGDFLARLGPLLAPLTEQGKVDTIARDLGNGQIALAPNWAAVSTDLIQRGGLRTIALLPTMAGPAGGPRLVSGQALALASAAPQRDHALALAAYLRQPATQATLARDLAWLPVVEEALAAAPDWQQPTATAYGEALRTARALPPLTQRADFDRLLGDAFRAIALDRADPVATLNGIAGPLAALR